MIDVHTKIGYRMIKISEAVSLELIFGEIGIARDSKTLAIINHSSDDWKGKLKCV